MERKGNPAPLDETQLVLSNCEREPIHIPGLVQPYGVLLCLDEKTLQIRQASENVETLLGSSPARLCQQSLDSLLSLPERDRLRAFLRETEFRNPYLISLAGPDGKHSVWDGFFHRHDGHLILELEPALPAPARDFYIDLQGTISRLQDSRDLQDLCNAAAAEVQRVSGFDRVMIYRFDELWNGQVIAEAHRDPSQAESYLGHRFPASDIPAQARAIFLSNWVRMIPDVSYVPSPILPVTHPRTGRPLDLSRTFIRSVSQIHIQYLKNMGVGASLTVSLIQDGRLWGLIAAHHRTRRMIPPEARFACKFIGKLTSSQLAPKEVAADREYKKQLRAVHESLVQSMQMESDLVSGLVRHSPNLLDLASSTGAAAAVHFEGTWALVGRTPSVEQIESLAQWLSENSTGGQVFHTDSLPSLWPAAEAFKDTACGILAISIPKVQNNYVLWFKPEVLQTATWAGDPRKHVEHLPDGSVRIDPRHSFESWKETVRNHSLPWRHAEIEAAGELRVSILALDLQRQFKKEQQARARAERLGREKEDLVATVSHDLKNPLTAIRIKLQVIQRAADQVTPAQLRDHAVKMLRSADRMQRLINDLLDVAKIEGGSFILERKPQNVTSLVGECVELLQPMAAERKITLQARSLESACHAEADADRVLQVLGNLVGNALKFTPENGTVTIAIDACDGEVIFSVQDTGPGIPPDQLPHLFDRFWQARQTQHLGTGLGLTIVKGIIEAHGGRIWVESEPGRGAKFLFTLPLPSLETSGSRPATDAAPER